MFTVYGCPNHYGHGDEGYIPSIEYLNLHYGLNIPQIPELTAEDPDPDPRLLNLSSVRATCAEIAQKQDELLQAGLRPLFICGDHSAAMGSVSGTSVHCQNPGLIWVDAHSDINTDQTTETGRIHGMPVAALLGLGEPSLTKYLTDKPKIKPQNIVYLGLRSVDPPEQELLDRLHILYFTYDRIQKEGLQTCLKKTHRHLAGCDGVHVSFDLDSMDPTLIPGVPVPVPSGFNQEEVYTILYSLLDHLPVRAMDIAELAVTHDIDHRSSDFTAKLITDLMNH